METVTRNNEQAGNAGVYALQNFVAILEDFQRVNQADVRELSYNDCQHRTEAISIPVDFNASDWQDGVIHLARCLVTEIERDCGLVYNMQRANLITGDSLVVGNVFSLRLIINGDYKHGSFEYSTQIVISWSVKKLPSCFENLAQ